MAYTACYHGGCVEDFLEKEIEEGKKPLTKEDEVQLMEKRKRNYKTTSQIIKRCDR